MAPGRKQHNPANAAADRLVARMRLVIAEMEPDEPERAIEAIRGVAPRLADRLEAPSADKH